MLLAVGSLGAAHEEAHLRRSGEGPEGQRKRTAWNGRQTEGGVRAKLFGDTLIRSGYPPISIISTMMALQPFTVGMDGTDATFTCGFFAASPSEKDRAPVRTLNRTSCTVNFINKELFEDSRFLPIKFLRRQYNLDKWDCSFQT